MVAMRALDDPDVRQSMRSEVMRIEARGTHEGRSHPACLSMTCGAANGLARADGGKCGGVIGECSGNVDSPTATRPTNGTQPSRSGRTKCPPWPGKPSETCMASGSRRRSGSHRRLSPDTATHGKTWYGQIGNTSRSRKFGPGDIQTWVGTRVYDLRHTAAVLMLTGGVSPKTVQEVLGHASLRMTLDVYGRWARPDLDSAAAVWACVERP